MLETLRDLTAQILDRIASANLLTAGALTVTALVCALVAYRRTTERMSFREFFEFAVPREVILHPSAKADLLFYVTKKALMPFLMIPAGVTFVVAVAGRRARCSR